MSTARIRVRVGHSVAKMCSEVSPRASSCVYYMNMDCMRIMSFIFSSFGVNYSQARELSYECLEWVLKFT